MAGYGSARDGGRLASDAGLAGWRDGDIPPLLFVEAGRRGFNNQDTKARSVWNARSLLPLSGCPTPYESASKLDALQALRVFRGSALFLRTALF